MLSSDDKTGYVPPDVAIPSPEPYLYHGKSMRGTFRFGDRLISVPASLSTLRPGDVVIYQHEASLSDQSENVVHRVIALTPAGAVTRGDSNPRNDIKPVTENRIIGRVTHFKRDGKLFRVEGGTRGMIKGWLLNLRYTPPRLIRDFFWNRIARLPFLRLPYRWLRQSGLIARIWHPTVTKILLETADGPVVKFVVHNRTVGKWWPQTNRFWCRRPYDLIILNLIPGSQPQTKTPRLHKGLSSSTVRTRDE